MSDSPYKIDVAQAEGLHDWERVVIVTRGSRTVADICDSRDRYKTIKKLKKELCQNA